MTKKGEGMHKNLQQIITDYTDDVAGDTKTLTADYILVIRGENIDGDEELRTYTSPGLSHITATGMLHFAQNDIWANNDEPFDD